MLAASNFADVEGYAFAFMHCWDLLKDEPKWRDPAEPGEGSDAPAGDTSLDSNRLNTDVGKSAGKRPMGRDRDKAGSKKSKLSDTSSSDYASRMQDLSLQKLNVLQYESLRKGERFQHLASIDEKWYQEMQSHSQSVLDIEKEKVQIMREKHEMAREQLEKQEDERILSINFDNCAPPLRQYYEALQEEILMKIAFRRQRRHSP